MAIFCTTSLFSAVPLIAAGTADATASTRQDRAAAVSGPSVVIDAAPTDNAQQAADLGTANAAAQDVTQGIAVIDRETGETVAAQGGDRVFNAESILKPFTAAYYLLQANGSPDPELVDELRAMIVLSDNDIQSALWDYDIIPTIAERYGLADTSNGPGASSESWGSDRTTAADQATFLYLMSQDPLVGPMLMSWMAETAPTGADEFNQAFGFNALTGDHGSKQGWSDPGWSPANLHSIGWSERYFAAVLQNSPTATYATMRATSTHTVQLIADVGKPARPEPETLQATANRFANMLAGFDTAAVGRQLGRTLFANDAVQLFGVGGIVAGSEKRC